MIVEKAFAKINIGLNIIGKRSDGYHDIDTVMQTIELHDVIKLEPTSGGISILCNNPYLPLDRRNTVWKAAEVFMQKAAMNINNNGIRIEIQKNIPSEAGLGGGSSDAAAVLRAMDKLFGTGYGPEELIELASMIGSDVPFLIEGGTVRAKGRGEMMEKLSDYSGIDTIIAMPDACVSTAEAYSLFSKCGNPFHPDIDSLAARLNDRNPVSIRNLVGNTFENLIFPLKPLIEKTKHDILETAPLVCSMTGSGSAVFGFYGSGEAACRAYEFLSAKYKTFITKTTGGVN